jgi:hypothetical protein
LKLVDRSLASGDSFKVLDVLGDVGFEAANLVKRSLGEDCKVPRVLGQDVGMKGFQDALHSAHLLYGLPKLVYIFDHRVTLRIPFR